MNTNELKNAWEQQKQYFEKQPISEEYILSVIREDFDKQMKHRRLLYKASLFVFLFTFCQACIC
jgi:hypothetical protein